MAAFVSKQMVVLPGIREYTATGSIALPGDYVEMLFNRQVQISQIHWAWELSAYWRLSVIDSMGLTQVIHRHISSYQNEYTLNVASGSLPMRVFSVPAGGKLRLEVDPTDTSGGYRTFLSCLAES